MMLDADVVAVSPSSVYRVLCDAGLMKKHNCKPSLKGKGFDQPAKPHEHWHVDVTYINIAGTFFYLCSLLDGYSRFIVHWEIRDEHDRGRSRDDHPAGTRAIPRRPAPDHLGQRPAVHRQGLQGVHPDLRNDSCENVTILSSEQRQDGAVVQDPERRVHPSQDAPEPGGRATNRRGFRGALQRRFACTVRSATSHPRTSWPVASRRSSPSGTASSMRRGNGGELPARRVEPPSDRARPGHCPSRLAALRWRMAWAEDRAPWRHDPSADPGTKTEGGRHDAALSFPSGLVRTR